jgi:hypothetical protein
MLQYSVQGRSQEGLSTLPLWFKTFRGFQTLLATPLMLSIGFLVKNRDISHVQLSESRTDENSKHFPKKKVCKRDVKNLRQDILQKEELPR